jgi:asparagine synthase (glutamine-hydrolysing)
MCGIYGVFWKDPARPVDARLLDRMGAALVHRGPDAGGTHVDGALGIGMRRLSVIDLVTGDQPIANEDGSAWVVFNGEIYNYRELRAELEGRGHRFTTASDTEVLVHLWEEHGEGFVERLRGMFALALWMPRRRELFLARDRLGIKPLYYAETPEAFVFASELKAIVRSGVLTPQVAPPAVAAYLTLGYVPDPHAILAGAAKLPPAHHLTVRAGRPSRPRRYWDPAPFFRDPLAVDERQACDLVWAALSDAVRSHLVSDVPVGAFLSGGVDSTAVVTLMAAHTPGRVKTFSVGFAEADYDESRWARRVAERLGTEHHELRAGAADLDVLDDVLHALDEPFADASAIPPFLVARLARRHVTVVLSGDGGDELFAGYDRYLVDHRRRRLGLLGDLGLGAPLRMLSGALPEGTPGKNYLYNLSLGRMDRYLDAIALFPPRMLAEIAEPEVAAVAAGDARRPAASVGLAPLSRLQDFDLRTYLPGDILTKVDRATMASSLEARVPLLDHPLVELACRIPAAWQLRAGETKSFFRRALRGRVPDEVLDRPKQGFAVPLERWFAAPLAGFFRERLAGGRALADAGIRAGSVRRLVALHERAGRSDHCRRLWALVVLQASLSRLLASDRPAAVAA